MNDFKKATKSCPDFREAKFQASGGGVILNDEVSWESREDSELVNHQFGGVFQAVQFLWSVVSW